MFAKSNSRTMYFKNLCGIIEINLSDVNGKKLESIKLTAAEALRGDFTVSETDGAVLKTSPAQPKDVVLSCGEGVELSSTAQPFRIAVPEGTYTKITLELTATDGSVVKYALGEDKRIEVQRSKRTAVNIGIAEKEWRTPYLNGKFSVSDTKQVQFSRGNLYCEKFGDTQFQFKFEYQQYDYRSRDNGGESTANISRLMTCA